MLNAWLWMLLGGAALSVQCSDLTLDPQDAQSDAPTAPDAAEDVPPAPRMDAAPAEASLDVSQHGQESKISSHAAGVTFLYST